MEHDLPLSPLLRRLRTGTQLSEGDVGMLLGVPSTIRSFKSQTCIVREGDLPVQCCLVMRGQVIRSRLSDDCKRQITSFHVPGDLPDLHNLYLVKADCDITAIGPSVVGFISHKNMHDLLARSPTIIGALWRETLIETAISREWELKLGGLDGPARVAHLLCEMTARLHALDPTRNLTFDFHWTQHDIGDACGLSNVHVNRIVQTLRATGVIDWRLKIMKIANWDELMRIGRFSPDYLHLPKKDETRGAPRLARRGPEDVAESKYVHEATSMRTMDR